MLTLPAHLATFPTMMTVSNKHLILRHSFIKQSSPEQRDGFRLRSRLAKRGVSDDRLEGF